MKKGKCSSTFFLFTIQILLVSCSIYSLPTSEPVLHCLYMTITNEISPCYNMIRQCVMQTTEVWLNSPGAAAAIISLLKIPKTGEKKNDFRFFCDELAYKDRFSKHVAACSMVLDKQWILSTYFLPCPQICAEKDLCNSGD